MVSISVICVVSLIHLSGCVLSVPSEVCGHGCPQTFHHGRPASPHGVGPGLDPRSVEWAILLLELLLQHLLCLLDCSVLQKVVTPVHVHVSVICDVFLPGCPTRALHWRPPAVDAGHMDSGVPVNL